MSNATLVESRTLKGAYDFDRVEAIVDHPKHGRLFLAEGWGGAGAVEGETYRWKHGRIFKVKADDTLDSRDLDAVALAERHDPDRPELPWDGYAIDSLAKSVGL